jgi:hypothetical protein
MRSLLDHFCFHKKITTVVRHLSVENVQENKTHTVLAGYYRFWWLRFEEVTVARLVVRANF